MIIEGGTPSAAAVVLVSLKMKPCRQRLCDHPGLGGLPEQANTAAHALLARCDQELLAELATVQRRQASLARHRTAA